WPQNIRRHGAKTQSICGPYFVNRYTVSFHRFRETEVLRIIRRRARDNRAAHFKVASHIVESVNVIRIRVGSQNIINAIQSSRPQIFRNDRLAYQSAVRLLENPILAALYYTRSKWIPAGQSPYEECER